MHPAAPFLHPLLRGSEQGGSAAAGPLALPGLRTVPLCPSAAATADSGLFPSHRHCGSPVTHRWGDLARRGGGSEATGSAESWRLQELVLPCGRGKEQKGHPWLSSTW